MSSIEDLTEALSHLKFKSADISAKKNEEMSQSLDVILEAIVTGSKYYLTCIPYRRWFWQKGAGYACMCTKTSHQRYTEFLRKYPNSADWEAAKKIGEKSATTMHLINSGLITTLSSLLNTENKLPDSINAKVAEILSELSKTEEARNLCSDISVVGPLMDLLTSEDSQTVVHACCALGTICYDNEVARGLVKEQQGVGKLIHLLQRLIKMNDLSESLKNVASGLLLNLSDAYDEIQEHTIQAGIVDVLLQYLERFYNDEDIAINCLLVLNCLADGSASEVGRTKLMEPVTLTMLTELLKKEISDDVMLPLLELLGSLTESDVVKLSLAKLSMCETLIDIMKKYEKKPIEGCQQIYKTACDLITLVLTGDSSMEYLYMDGKGPVYKETMSWMSSPNESLQIAGALAAGNFARKDDFCIHMVQDNVATILLSLLERHSGKDGDIRLQHAILSALRNLAIPSENKQSLAKLGVVDKILPMVEVETFPVVFKLLATLRMLIDQQETVATSLGLKGDVVRQIVDWCCTDDHPGVQGEASRLLAWIIKNSKSKSVMEVLLDEGALPHLVAMINSEHEVMQNEALTALLFLTSTVLGDIESQLRRTGVIDALHNCLNRPYDEVSVEVLRNALSVTSNLMASGVLRNEILLAGIDRDFAHLTSKHPDSSIQQQARSYLEAFNSLMPSTLRRPVPDLNGEKSDA